MSLSKSKSFLTGVLLAIFFATTGSAMAVEGMRLWRPYQPESFGGSRRSNDGFYASVEGILWNVSKVKNIPIGYRNPDGSSGTRTVFDGGSIITQGNSMNTSGLSNDFKLGTRVEVGNIRGHHGWLFSGYGLSGAGGSFIEGNYQSPFDSFSGSNNNNNNNSSSGSSGSNNNNNSSSTDDIGLGNFSTMVIKDSLTLSTAPYFAGNIVWNKIWQPETGTFNQIDYPISFMDEHSPVGGVGYLWGWTPMGIVSNANADADSVSVSGLYLAPLPINFRYANVTNRVNLVNFELMYTYRPHPMKWGELEFLAGARYWDMDDRLKFIGLSFTEKEISVNNGNNSSGSSGSSSSSNSNNNSNDSGYTSTEEKEIEELYLSNIRTTIVGQIRNRVTGPQIGVKLNRRNARWTFGAEARFLAGINAQSQTVSGNLVPQYMQTPELAGSSGSGSSSSSSNSSSDSTNNFMINNNILPYHMIGLYNNQRSFYHHRTKTYFSPGVELRLTAKWQWTDAVGVQLGFNSTIVDNVGRGADIIDYRIQDNGQFFGLRDSSKTTVIVYGFNFGLSMRR